MKANKILALFLSIILISNFASCGNDNTEKSKKNEKQTTTESVADNTTEKTDNSTDEATKPTENNADETTTDIKPDTLDDTTDGITPLLYKVTDGNGNILWLFGSIHVGMEYFYPLPDYVTNAYNSADALAVEFDVVSAESDYGAMIKAMMPMMYSDGTEISDHISDDLYTEAKKVLNYNSLYFSVLDKYKPVMWSSFIDACITEALGYDSFLGIDYHLLNKAHDDGKTVYDIESMELQFGLLADFSEELQILLLQESVESYNDLEGYQESMNDLVSAWESGDEEVFAQLLTDDGDFESPEEEALYNEYNNAMVISRNIAMADYAEDALNSGEEVFICVGAAHIVGKGAMADLLTQRGYTVEIIK